MAILSRAVLALLAACALACAVIVATSCGDPLVDGGYRGEPLYSFRGTINDFRFEDQRGLDRYRASIFWSVSGETSTASADLVEQKTIVVSNIFPPNVEIKLYNPPEGAGLERVFTPYYLGLIYLYEDFDENGQMDDGELRGGASMDALLFAKREIPASESPSRHTIPAGYSLQELPMPCDVVAGVETASREENCGAVLGIRCEFADDCGTGGVCGAPELPGQCTLPYQEGGCRPKQGAYYPELMEDGMTFPAEGWFLACDGDEDCPSGQDLTCKFYGFADRDDNYVGACMPKQIAPTQIDIFEEFGCTVAPLCFPDYTDTPTVAFSFGCK